MELIYRPGLKNLKAINEAFQSDKRHDPQTAALESLIRDKSTNIKSGESNAPLKFDRDTRGTRKDSNIVPFGNCIRWLSL